MQLWLKLKLMIKTIIFDWKRTLYNPDSKTLTPGAVEILEFLKGKNVPLILIGKGGEDMNNEVERLGVRKYFKSIIFAEGEKDVRVFTKCISKVAPETIFIGDRVRSELEIGNRLGATTIWVKQGKFASEEPENEQQKPTFTATSLPNCLRILQNLV